MTGFWRSLSSRAARRLRRDRRGVAAIETALVIPVLLLPLLAGVVGSGQALLEQYRIDRALHAALFYAWGMQTGTTANIQAMAQSGYGGASPNMTATASYACYCIAPAGTRASGTTVACTGSCSNGQVLGTWVTVRTSVSFTPIFTMPWGSAGWTLSSTGTARVQ